MPKEHDPVLSEALRLHALGIAPHWLKKQSKAPIANNWSDLPVASAEKLRDTYRQGFNLGIRLGEPSRIGNLYLHVGDVDINDESYYEEARAAAQKLFGNFEQYGIVKSGSGGRSRHIYFLSETPFRSRKLAQSKETFTVYDPRLKRDVVKRCWEIELFGTGKQVAVPPSLHDRTGQPYVWLKAFDKETCRVIPAHVIESWGVAKADEQQADGEAVGNLDYVTGRLMLPTRQIRGVLAALDHVDFCEDYHGWIKVGMALHHEYAGSEQGLKLWNDFSEKSGKYDPAVCDSKWKSFGKVSGQPVRFVSIVQDADMLGILTDEQRELLDQENEADDGQVVAGPRRLEPLDELDHKPRAWLVPGCKWHIRKNMTLTSAAPGIGKTTIALAEAVAMASGVPTIIPAPPEPLNVWYWNLEDPVEEIRLRIKAICKHYDIDMAAVSKHFFLNGAEDELIIARELKGGLKIYVPKVDAMINFVRSNDVAQLTLDPFVSSHEVNENSNSQINAVAKAYKRIAIEGNCGIQAVTHNRKGGLGQTEFTADDNRGAGSLSAAARIHRTVNRMTEKDAKDFRIDDHPWSYIRMDNGKANMTPPSKNADWARLVSVQLMTRKDGEIVPGENVQAIERWEPVLQTTLDFSEQQRILTAMGKHDWKRDYQAKDEWIGHPIADAMGLDVEDEQDRKRIRELLKIGLAEGWLKEEKRIEGGKKRPYIIAVRKSVESTSRAAGGERDVDSLV